MTSSTHIQRPPVVTLLSKAAVYSAALAQNVVETVVEQTISALHLKRRHVLTRDNRLRLRYLVSGTAGLALAVGLHLNNPIAPNQSLSTFPELANSLEQEPSAETTDQILSLMIPQNSLMGTGSMLSLNAYRDSSGQIRRDREVIRSKEMLAESDADSISPAAQEKTIEIAQGDTLSEALEKAGINSGESQSIITEISRHYNMRGLRPGQQFNVTLEPAETDSGYEFAKLSFTPDPLRTIEVTRDDSGDFHSRIDEKQIQRARESRVVEIDGSVYGSADKAELPDRITANTIRLFSYAIDFQRDIHQGDKMEVLYDSYKTDDGYLAKTGDIIFARMTLGGKPYSFYRYETLDGQVDYYTQDGRSIRKSSGLMKTPVAFGRISSGFGMRRHPVLGYSKMHKGMDFAAPTGTKVFASADGVIERAGRFSTFGNYIRIRHSSKLATAYAHLNGYAKGIRPGVRVKQGQLIGYVGTTGRSTGPHLHYEVMVNNVQVNPASVKFAADNSLNGKELKRFKDQIRRMNQEFAQNQQNTRVTLAENTQANPVESTR